MALRAQQNENSHCEQLWQLRAISLWKLAQQHRLENFFFGFLGFNLYGKFWRSACEGHTFY